MENVLYLLMADNDVKFECDVGGHTRGHKYPHRDEESVGKMKKLFREFRKIRVGIVAVATIFKN